jgi:3-dehydroquinate dehydratase
MGQIGTITRVAAPLLGAEFTYASLEPKLATAPGQLAVDEMKDIYNMMK